MNILNALLPVFLAIAVGYALRRGGFWGETSIRDVNNLCFWIGLPALLFSDLASTRIDPAMIARPAAALIVAMFVCLFAGYGAAKMLRGPAGSTPSTIHASFRGNLAFVGLSILMYLHPSGPVAAMTLMLLGMMVPLYNILGVLTFTMGTHEKRPMGETVRAVVFNPLLLSCVAGAAWSMTGRALPVWIARTLEQFGSMALPLALLSVGGMLHWEKLRGRKRLVIAASLLKCLLCPVAAWAMAKSLGLDAEATRVVLIFAACPTAAASFVMSERMGGDPAVASGAVALSTVLSFPVLALLLAMF